MGVEELGGVPQLPNNPPRRHPPSSLINWLDVDIKIFEHKVSDKRKSDGFKEKKKRHVYWRIARKIICKFCCNKDELKNRVENVVFWCGEYVKDIENKAILLSKGDKRLVLPYITRHTERYRKRIRRKFNKVIRITRYIKGRHTFLTITFHLTYPVSLYIMHSVFSKGVSDLIDRIKKVYGFTAYIKSFEFAKNYSIHAHILFLNIGYIDPNWLKKQLKACGLGKIFKIKEFKGDTEPAIRYFFKYLTKSLKSNEFLALSWALNIRTFSWSKIINDKLTQSKDKTNSEELGSGWIYEGVIYWYVDVFGVMSYDEFLKYIGHIL